MIGPDLNYENVTDHISSVVLTPLARTPKPWLLIFTFAFALTMLLFATMAWLFAKGIGIWGVDIPVAWGFAITNFVWWIGIGHAGTLISAILLLLNQRWRTSINRFAEAMTLFAVAQAGLFPILHLGRPWLFYWLIPYPATMDVWPNFRSPLVWDIFAVTTYLTISLVFWYVGLVPDLATMRDTAKSKAGRIINGILALGWRGSARHWRRYQMAYLLLAGLATPLVVSVHTVVSFDFSIAILPGWHTTIFPPYFVAGAIYSGFAMVLMIAIPLRSFYKLDQYVTLRHLDNAAKLLLVTGLIVTYGYVEEFFMAWYSGDKFEAFEVVTRALGPYAVFFWLLLGCNVVAVQTMWWGRLRRNLWALWIVAFLINTGMWIERFVIVVVSLHRDFLPSSWGNYFPTWWDGAALAGTLGFFVALLFLFLRGLPMLSMSEMKELVHEAREGTP